PGALLATGRSLPHRREGQERDRQDQPVRHGLLRPTEAVVPSQRLRRLEPRRLVRQTCLQHSTKPGITGERQSMTNPIVASMPFDRGQIAISGSAITSTDFQLTLGQQYATRNIARGLYGTAATSSSTNSRPVTLRMVR